MAIKEYKVKSIISHNGVELHPGDLVGIEEKQDKVLVDLGVVEATGREFKVDGENVSTVPENAPPAGDGDKDGQA